MKIPGTLQVRDDTFKNVDHLYFLYHKLISFNVEINMLRKTTIAGR